MRKWIPVNERLPEDYGQFLAYGSGFDQDGDGVYRVGEARYCMEAGWDWLGDGWDKFPVTHWMPLPDRPEEEPTK